MHNNLMEDWEYEEAQRDEERRNEILGQTAVLLAERGDSEAAALLADVQSVVFADTDEVARTVREEVVWGDGTVTRTMYQRAALLDVEFHLISRFTDTLSQRIADVLSYVAERHGENDIIYVKARAALPDVSGDWRTTLANRLAADRPTNQARKERTSPNHPMEDGLTFGSPEERKVYLALKRLQTKFPEDDAIAILSLPGVYLRAGHTWSPDLMVLGRGRALIIEVDGPHHRAQRRYADDRNRDLQWQRCGIPVVRLPVEDLRDDERLSTRLNEELRRYLPAR